MLQPAPEPGLIPAPVTQRILRVQRLRAVVEILLCSGFPSQLFLIAVLTGSGMQLRTAEGGLSPAFVFTLSLLDTGIVMGLVFFFLRAHRESAREVLLGHRPVGREMLLGLGLVPVVFALVLLTLGLVVTLAPSLHNVPRNPLESMLQNRQDAAIFAIVVTVAGGVREEVQRGFIVHRFGQFLGGRALGVVVYSAVFGLGHVEQGYDAALATALLGATWGFVYLARRSIVAPMVSHGIFNLAQLVKYVALR